MKAKKLALSALFICIAGALSALESRLPPICPIPAVRVGLGNIVTMFVIYAGIGWKSRDAVLISILRCFFAALITGAIMNIFYGAAGGLFASFAMLLIKRLLPGEKGDRFLPFVGVAGAAAHITGQMLVAVLFYGSPMVLAYTPVLMSSAIIGGAFTGGCTLLLRRKLSPSALKLLDVT